MSPRRFSLLASLLAGGLGFAEPAAAAPSCPVPPLPGVNPSNEQMATLIRSISRGPAQAQWGASSLPRLLPLTSGCAHPTKVPAFVPCEVLHGIAETESNHQQFKNGKTLISHDCGYGLTQVTSGMRGGAGFDPARVAGDALYNLATGALILSQKWAIRHCVGERRPQTIEHWYRAIWGYNGLSYINNPTNPIYSAVRGVWNPKTESRRRPYQELVFGYIENPPNGRWRSVALAYPDPLVMVPSELVASGHPQWPEPSCASPTDCVNRRRTHVSACADSAGAEVTPVATGSDPPLAGGTPTASASTSVPSTPTTPTSSPAAASATPSTRPPSTLPSAGGDAGAAGADPIRSPVLANDSAATSCDRCELRGSPAAPSRGALLACAAAFALGWYRQARRRR